MHTHSMRSAMSLPGRLLLTTTVAALALSGCGGDTKDTSSDGSTSPGSSGSTGSSSATASPYLPVPDGVELTAQGSELAIGDSAVVAYDLPQDHVGALDITVTRLERTTFKQSFQGWRLDAETKKTNPYFVRATVRNVGDTDLGGQPVPLYVVDGTNTLIPATTFKSTFAPCPSTPFPKKFKNGAKVDVCLVYLAPDHGDLTAVEFRPTEKFNPITWTGELKSPKGTKKSGKKG